MNLKILGYFLSFSKFAWGPNNCRNFRGPLGTCPVYPMVNAPLFRGLSPLCYFLNIIEHWEMKRFSFFLSLFGL